MPSSTRVSKSKAVSAKSRNRKPTAVSKSQPFRASSNSVSHASSKPNRTIKDGKSGSNFRDKSTIRRLKMYTQKAPDKSETTKQKLAPVRIEPDRRWFGNTRVVSQSHLDQFRQALATSDKDPMSVLVKKTKLPVSLFDHSNEKAAPVANNLLVMEPFKDVLQNGVHKKRPRLQVSDLSELAASAKRKKEEYDESKDRSLQANIDAEVLDAKTAEAEPVFRKGTSRRIWGELYKVVDSSDVIIQVLDARDPLGTRCKHLEEHLLTERKNKHLVLLLNKCDLIPNWVAKKWVHLLSKEYPTVAYRASQTKPFGKKTLIALLRQFADLLRNRKHVSIGFIGYPNVGKSSVINSLKGKEVCKTAPIPGETKVWQYISLTSKLYLIDCPGVVASSDPSDDIDKVLKSVVRAEKIENPHYYIDAVLERVTEENLRKRYKVDPEFSWTNGEEFLEHVAMKRGRLLKKGEPDLAGMAKTILFDFQRGKLPYFVTAWHDKLAGQVSLPEEGEETSEYEGELLESDEEEIESGNKSE